MQNSHDTILALRPHIHPSCVDHVRRMFDHYKGEPMIPPDVALDRAGKAYQYTAEHKGSKPIRVPLDIEPGFDEVHLYRRISTGKRETDGT